MKAERLTSTEADALRVGQFLLDFFAREHRFGSLPTTSIDAERAWRHIWRMLADGAVWIVADADGAIAGSIAVIPDELWWSDRAFLRDGWFYLRPDRRGSPAAAVLLAEALAHASERALPLAINVFHSGKAEAVGRYLARQGFAPLGGLYVKEP